MRRLMPFAVLALAACSGNQATAPAPISAPPSRTLDRVTLTGMSRSDVTRYFGTPALTVQEGPGTKLQYRGKSCVIDFYFYPPESGAGEARVTHVDARDHDGRDVGKTTCASALAVR